MFLSPIALSRRMTLRLLLVYGQTFDRSYGFGSSYVDARREAACTSLRSWSQRSWPDSGKMTDELISAWELTLAMSWGLAVAEDRGIERSEAEDIASIVGQKLYRATHPHGDWDHLMSELSRRRESLTPPAIGNWVRTAVGNEHLARLRKLRRRPALVELTDAIPRAWSPDDARRAVDLEDVIARLGDGPLERDSHRRPALSKADDRLALRLVASGMTPVDVAKVLRVTPTAVRKRLARMRERYPELAAALGRPDSEHNRR